MIKEGQNLPLMPEVNKTYYIPNTFEIYEAQRSWKGFTFILPVLASQVKNNIEPDLKRGSYKDEHVIGNDMETFKSSWQADGIYGFIFIGHGDKNGHGLIIADMMEDAATPKDVKSPL